MNISRNIGIALIIIILLLSATGSALAGNLLQTPEPDGPIYVVLAGDSLWGIASRFRVAMTDLAAANGINDPSQLVAGAQLVIPGLQGVQGVLTTREVGLGETLRSISRYYQIPEAIIIRLNHLTSPEELYAGATLVLPEHSSSAGLSKRSILSPGQSLLELAILLGKTPWDVLDANQLTGSWSALPGDVLHTAMGASVGTESENGGDIHAWSLPGELSEATLNPTRLVQGKTAVITIAGLDGVVLGGELNEKPLHFFPDGEGNYVSLQGVHALAEPGLYLLTITGTLPAGVPFTGTSFGFSQGVLVSSGDYPFDPVLIVSPETIDPAVTKPEDAEWAALTATATSQKLWKSEFTSPAPPPFTDCWPSRFGNRRSYNGSEYSYFHSGLDFCGGVGTEILAPAAGKVVFAGPLTVRGNATVIDHGWGIYSGYLHQSDILVNVGEMVTQGQVIGKVGGTGRVTGPHLHWEIWAGGVQVDPLDWLSQSYP